MQCIAVDMSKTICEETSNLSRVSIADIPEEAECYHNGSDPIHAVPE